ncbi:MAG: hypothetical protein LM577_01095 [Thermoproteaceae archaeon]|nr:hypothetical protein [Thermoproteaceae archaeon]
MNKERIYRGATARIAAEIGVPDGRRYRIELRGPTAGAPYRLSKIVERARREVRRLVP